MSTDDAYKALTIISKVCRKMWDSNTRLSILLGHKSS